MSTNNVGETPPAEQAKTGETPQDRRTVSGSPPVPGTAGTLSPAPEPLVLVEPTSCDWWQVAPTTDGKVAVILRRGGQNGAILAWIKFEPGAVLRMVSAASKEAAKIDPTLPMISLG